ncbi:MAG TPA: hypothetical protein VGV37_18945 [Aliidongia sp.]|uniref:hypothetical protein n=1 Tax=Aliidongia sp. TaxID=1914230 RepID=UPI002DDD3E37|nr:hypothetical protein [Aliidongia sp.]HEV2676611.1 hypothetical protein [Aliidongia sp.]
MIAGSAPPAIIVHSLAQALVAAEAAAALGKPLTLRSAAGAGSTVGVGWFASLGTILFERHPALDLTLVLDCADEAGTALGALRRGLKAVRVAGSPDVLAKLAALADGYGARLDRDERPCLDLIGGLAEQVDLAARCRDWLKD